VRNLKKCRRGVSRRTLRWLVLLLVMSMLVAAPVDPVSQAGAKQPILPPVRAEYLTASGAIAIVGYNDMAEMLTALTAHFANEHPGFVFALDLKGTRTAPPALASGRELADFCAATGGKPLAIRVAHASLDPRALSGPLAIFVHRSNPLTSLTFDEVAAIFSGADQSRGLRPTGLGPETALGLFFRQQVLGTQEFSDDFSGMLQSADVVKRVGADEHAIGFAAAMRATPGVKILALSPRAGEAPIALSAENLSAGRYPLDRHLLIYARQPLEPWVREFLAFAVSSVGQQIVGRGTLGYLPLNASDAATELGKIRTAP